MASKRLQNDAITIGGFMPTPKPKTITFRLSDELLEDLKRLADDEGRSINSMLTELVKRAAKKQDGEETV